MSLRREAVPVLVAVDALINDVLLRTLEPAIAALDRLFESARSAPHDDGEPDGFDGLDRRGSLERLLPTEWLLATEAPDEFIRRYEHRELGYLRLNSTRPQRPQTALVLFDTGPDQLGRPRVAQLATLVVLARRAAAAGAELRWGSLQHPGRHTATGSDTIEAFIAARTLAPPGELPLDAFVDDSLVVSPLPGPPYAARQLVLSDEGDAVAAQLVDRRGGGSHRALIPMPRPEDGVRLLRNPTGARAPSAGPAKTRAAPISNLVFDERGNKLLARIEPHRLAVYPVPNSAHDTQGRIRYVATLPRDGVIAAAGRVKKSVLTVNVIKEGKAIVVSNFGGNVTGPTGRYDLEGDPIPVPTIDSPLGRLTWADGKLRVHLGVYRLTQIDGGYRVDWADQSRRWGPAGSDLSATPVEGRWVMRFGAEEWYDEGPVFGLYVQDDWSGGSHHRSPRIVVLSEDGRTLLALGPKGEEHPLYQAGEVIVDAVVHPESCTYAVRTASGRVVVRSRGYDSTLYETSPE